MLTHKYKSVSELALVIANMSIQERQSGREKQGTQKRKLVVMRTN